MGTNAVEIDDVTKRFRLYHEKPHSLKERAIKLGRNTAEDFWALKGVSFEVAEGETFGLLGHNGSGKSTLLKCVAGTLRPTAGSIRVRGRIAALLELGAGFHPELTGRENVYLNGSILGFSAKDVDRIFDDIVAFAELEAFIDNQVKHYSSGMYARLGFAVAVNVDPDVLVVDEVLAVGDEAFQRKCLERIKQFQRDGRSILLVTHAPDIVRQICDRAAVLDHGELIDIATPGEAVRSFRHSLLERGIELTPEDVEAVRQAKLASQTGAVRFDEIAVDYPDPERGCLLPGDPLRIRVGYDAPNRVEDVVFAMEIYDQEGLRLLGINTDILDSGIDSVEGNGEVVFEFDEVNLNDGTYDISLGIHTHDGGTIYAQREQQDHFQVMNPGQAEGRVHFPMRAFHKRVGASRG